jgi:MFS family permease
MRHQARRPHHHARGPNSVGFLVVAFAVGASFGAVNFGSALLALADAGSSTLVGVLGAALTAGTMAGALVGGRLVARRGAASALAVAVMVDLVGVASLLLPVPVIAATAGCAAAGGGMGLFWVASQAALGSSGGTAYVRHYGMYTIGTALGGPGAGWVIGLLAGTADETVAQVRASFLVGVVVLLVAALAWPYRAGERPAPGDVTTAAPRTLRPWPRLRQFLARGARLQTADLLLVIGFNTVFVVVPVMLRREYGLRAEQIGVFYGLVAVAKVVGSAGGNRLARRFGEARIHAGGLGVSGLVLGAAPWLDSATAFSAMVLASVALGLGQWATLMSAAVNRMAEEHRPGLLSSWNVREYAAISAAAFFSGVVLDATDSPVLVLGVAGATIVAAGFGARALFASEAAPLRRSRVPAGR